MKPTLAFLITTLAASTNANTCVRQQNGAMKKWLVHGPTGITNIAAFCNGLWDNLKSHPGCPPSETFCGAAGEDNHVQWNFKSGAGCHGTDVQDVWYAATKNREGPIDCYA